MYEKISGGKIFEIDGLECCRPPVPPLHEIEGFHLPKKDQKWRRPELPTFKASQIDIFSGDYTDPTEILTWEEARREEIIKQTGCDPWDLTTKGDPKAVSGVVADPDYVSEALEEFRSQELDKVNPWEGGFWFMNYGEPTYITPFHYFYLAWWKIDSGYPEYRESDRDLFYHWQYCFEDPICLGQTEADKRGGGKSARAGSIIYLTTIHKKNCHSGIQSKTDEDSKGMFMEKIVEPYKDLPDFLIPINANSTDPKDGLLFFAPSKRGKNSRYAQKEQKMALRSHISYRNSKEKAYDSTTIRGVLIRDEEGKCETVDVWTRHAVTRECVYRDGKVIGKIYSTTTVAEMGKGGANFKKLWDASNPRKRNPIGMTKSGLYKIFRPAYVTAFSDQYGRPVIDEPTAEQLPYILKRYGEHARHGAKHLQKETRKSLEGDPIALQLEILQNPWTEEELFQHEGKDCQYNLNILRRQEKIVNDPEFTGIRIGDFIPADSSMTKMRFVDNPKNGMWHVAYLFEDPERDANRYDKVDRIIPAFADENSSRYDYFPLNTHRFTGGFDPTRSGRTVDKRRSSAAGTIFRKFATFDPDLSETWIADFKWEPDDPEQAWVYFLYGCMYYGCQFLPETQVPIPKSKLISMGLYNFIMWRPESTFTGKGRAQAMEGVPASTQMNERMIQTKRTHIQHHGHKLILPRVIHDSIGFTPERRTQFDIEVASQLSLTATEKLVDQPDQEAVDISNYFNF